MRRFPVARADRGAGMGKENNKSKRELVEQLSTKETVNDPWEQLISIFDAIDEKVYVADPVTYEILYANPAMKKIFGEKILGEKCHKVMQDLDAPCPFCTNDLIFGENLGKTHIWEFQNRRNGKWRRRIDKAVKWADGRMARFEMAIDIHNRKVAEDALQESEARYRLLVETMNEGFSIADENGIRTYANKRLCDMLGYEMDEIVGHPVTKFLDKEGRKVWVREFEKRRKRESTPYEMNFVRKDGERVPTIVSPRPIFDEKGVFKGSFAAITDISNLKRTEESLKEREKELNVKTTNLEEMNAALRILLRRMEVDRRELEDKVRLNIQQMIQPYLERLKAAGMGDRQRKHLETLEANLQEILSPFTHKLLTDYPRLTPSELQIANLLRQGKSSKEIADELSLSERTVETHRRNMRTKLGIKDKKTNLRSYLLTNQYT
jgi:PAS domain S-box-containing protein